MKKRSTYSGKFKSKVAIAAIFCPSGSYYYQLQNQENKPVMIYAIYKYGLRMEAIGFLGMHMFWHLQFSVSGFAIFGDSLYSHSMFEKRGDVKNRKSS